MADQAETSFADLAASAGRMVLLLRWPGRVDRHDLVPQIASKLRRNPEALGAKRAQQSLAFAV